MTPDQERLPSASLSRPLAGEIVGLESKRVRVRLETAAIGFVTEIAEAEIQSSFRLGQHGTFQILRCDEKGETLLSVVSLQDSEKPHSFEHEVNRIQNAVNHHQPVSILQDAITPILDEQQIEQWLNRVTKGLAKLKRNRAKRLDEEFYSGS